MWLLLGFESDVMPQIFKATKVCQVLIEMHKGVIQVIDLLKVMIIFKPSFLLAVRLLEAQIIFKSCFLVGIVFRETHPEQDQ